MDSALQFRTFFTPSLLRARYKTDPGFQRYVGWCVITKNLFSIARYQERRRIHGKVD